MTRPSPSVRRVPAILRVAAVVLAVAAPPARAAGDCDPPPVAGASRVFTAPFSLEGAVLPRGAALAECLPAGAGASPALRSLEAAADRLLSLGELGARFAEVIDGHGVRLCVHAHVDDARGWFEPEGAVLSVSAALPEAVKTLVLAHELRHVDQWARGFRLTLDVTVAEYVRRTYALEADAAAVAAFAGWASRGDGRDDVWDAALALDRYGDVAEAFGRGMEATDDPAAALLAAFRAWYASPWRTTGYWRSACGNYLDRVDEAHAEPGRGRLPDDAFAGLCVVPGAGDYGCAASAEIAAEVSVPAP